MKLNFKRLELQLAHDLAIARSAASRTAKVVVLELTGADGTVGLGEAAPTARYKESVDSVEAFLRKVDPRGLFVQRRAGQHAIPGNAFIAR